MCESDSMDERDPLTSLSGDCGRVCVDEALSRISGHCDRVAGGGGG